MKAMIVAAGRGERLRPITDNLAKPLVPVHGKPLIVHHLLALAQIGVTDVVINLCYRADQIKAALGDGNNFNVTIHYSSEQDMLGVGGGMVNARHLLGDEPFILISADIYTDFPLATLRLDNQQLGHLVLVDNRPDHPHGDFGLVHKRVTLDTTPKLTYGSIAILHPQLLQGLSVEKQGIIPILAPAIADGLISGEHYQGMLHNVGSIAELEAADQ